MPKLRSPKHLTVSDSTRYIREYDGGIVVSTQGEIDEVFARLGVFYDTFSRASLVLQAKEIFLNQVFVVHHGSRNVIMHFALAGLSVIYRSRIPFGVLDQFPHSDAAGRPFPWNTSYDEGLKPFSEEWNKSMKPLLE